MSDLAQRLADLSAKATGGVWHVDGPPNNRIIWSSPQDRVCFMANSNGANNARDIATSELIPVLVNAFRAGELVPATTLAAKDAEIARLKEAMDWLAKDPDLPRPFGTFLLDTLANRYATRATGADHD